MIFSALLSLLSKIFLFTGRLSNNNTFLKPLDANEERELFILIKEKQDKDAEENIRQITPRLRDIDKIHLVSCGEFEDLLPKSLIIKTVNSHFKNFISIKEEDLLNEIPTAKILEEFFKQKGLHEFKKAEFAKLVRENILNDDDISTEIKEIIKKLQY